MVRLVQVAKILGMTGQQLRKELTDVDFGVKPTDREVPDNLAQGIVRFIARKHGIAVNFDELSDSLHAGGGSYTADAQAPARSEQERDEEAPPPDGEKKEAPSVHVLRKLTLDDVSSEAIEQQKRAIKQAQSSGHRPHPPRRRPPAGVHAQKRKPAAAVSHQEQIKKKEGKVTLPESLTVKEFAEKSGIQIPKVIQTLMKNGVLATVNQQIDYDTASIVAAELGVQVEKGQESVSFEALIKQDLRELLKDDPENLAVRPPIVTVMGHVDHGKTAILDAIRETDVVSGEAGGITQHIGAYQVEHDGKKITFLDTPGHEAFTAMRARGAQVTDIAVLVVAADESVKPTTIEAIHHAKEAQVPIIVAVNKIDKPNADIDRVRGDLSAQGLQPEEWGGQTPFVPCSAVTKQGITDLLDHIQLIAEERALKANPHRNAVATVIESHLSSAHGPVATVIVNTGTLSVGDIIACGSASGRVKVLLDAHGAKLDKVPPSGPARLSGLSDVAQVGDIVQVFATERAAREFVDVYRETKAREAKHGFADLVSRLTEGKLSQLKIVLKADAQGSLESIEAALKKLTTEKVQPKVIHAAIGAVTETDVMMAAASDGIVVGFNVDVPTAVHKTAEREGIEIKNYDIIYKLLEDAELLLSGLIEPIEEEKVIGHVEIRGLFLLKKGEQIIGGKVTDGSVKRLPFRVLRGDQTVGTGRITSLKQVDRDVKEVKEGAECGMRVDAKITIEMGDVLEVVSKEFKRAES